jgi:phosphatidate cytidylyltransferase
MRQRLISAAVLVPLALIVLLAGPPWISLAIAGLAAVAAWETARLLRLAGLPAVTWLAVAAPLLSVLAFETIFLPGGVEWGWTLIPGGLGLWLMAAALPAMRQHDPRLGLMSWLGTVLAGLYASLLAFAVGLTKFQTTASIGEFEFQTVLVGYSLLLVLVLTVWSLDSAAYVVGRLAPRGRFFPHLSPNKTWSGAIGGTLAAIAVFALLGWLMLGYEPWWGAALGLVTAVAAQAGDLAESMLKRAAGVKDSSALVPGHGGILDRIDSFLFAAPTLYALVAFAHLAAAGGLV